MSVRGLAGRPANGDVGAAREYHERTIHTPFSVRTSGHELDFDNYPSSFKRYRGVERVALERTDGRAWMPALDAIARVRAEREEAAPGRDDLAGLLHLSAGITRTRAAGERRIYFRAAANTGALYEIELYLVCADLPDLPAGVYHFAAHDHSLDVLRRGDFRGVVVEATGGEPAAARAPALLICTGTYWRNAWKYQDRTYRHFGWDNGTLLANTLAVGAALDLPARLLCGFADDDSNRLLGLDTAKEVAFSMVALGRSAAATPPAPALEPLALEIEPVSRYEIDYPLMRDLHAASSLASGAEAASWREQGRGWRRPARPTSEPPLPLPTGRGAGDGIGDVIRRRGSTRRFAPDPIPAEDLAAVLRAATRGLDADYREPGPSGRLNELYLIVNAVEGIAPGAYYYDDAGGLVPLRRGDFRREAGFLDLEQDLAADAAVNVYFMADLAAVLDRYGNRGYRAAQLEAGILGGKLYLAAYALGRGATGLTFYDEDVTGFFAPHAAGLSAIFLVALGVPHRRHA